MNIPEDAVDDFVVSGRGGATVSTSCMVDPITIILAPLVSLMSRSVLSSFSIPRHQYQITGRHLIPKVSSIEMHHISGITYQQLADHKDSK